MSRIALLCALVAAAIGAAIPFTANAAGGDDGTQPVFTSSGVVAFNFIDVGQSAVKTLTVGNASDVPMAISKVELSGPDLGDFSIVGDTCTGQSVTKTTTCAVQLKFAPTKSGTRVAAVRFTDNTPCRNFVTVAGSGTDANAPARAQTSSCETGGTVTSTTTVTQSTTTTVTPRR